MLALFSAAPPQATQTLFRLSLCRHAYTACELRTSASISPPPLQVRVRGARRPASEAAATVAAATTTTAAAEVRMCRGGGAHTHARTTAAATGGGGVATP